MYSAYSDPLRFWLLSPFRAGIHEYGEYTAALIRPAASARCRAGDAAGMRGLGESGDGEGGLDGSFLYSAALVNTRRR